MRDSIVINSYCKAPEHAILNALAFLGNISDKYSVDIFEEETRLDGYTYHDEDTIYVVISPTNGEFWLTLAHELVHVHQIMNNKPLCEDEAYGKESDVRKSLISSL